MGRNIKRLEGYRFGRLTVLSFASLRAHRAYWRCICTCGLIGEYPGSRLVSRNTKSCGCLRVDTASKLAKPKHGMSNTTEYRSWNSMQQRCYNPNKQSYPRWGGRGIGVCDRWRGPFGFVNFLTDMGLKPGLGYSIDRYPNNNGDYEPKNCRWATSTEQQHNRRDNKVRLSSS